ncbi:MAG: helix-turn-helix domain-containing protein [Promethearchaeota archaeon]
MKKVTPNLCFCEACQRFYSISTIAERWDLSQKTIRRMINGGQIKAKRIRGSVRIPHSELLKVIEDI